MTVIDPDSRRPLRDACCSPWSAAAAAGDRSAHDGSGQVDQNNSCDPGMLSLIQLVSAPFAARSVHTRGRSSAIQSGCRCSTLVTMPRYSAGTDLRFRPPGGVHAGRGGDDDRDRAGRVRRQQPGAQPARRGLQGPVADQRPGPPRPRRPSTTCTTRCRTRRRRSRCPASGEDISPWTVTHGGLSARYLRLQGRGPGRRGRVRRRRRAAASGPAPGATAHPVAARQRRDGVRHDGGHPLAGATASPAAGGDNAALDTFLEVAQAQVGDRYVFGAEVKPRRPESGGFRLLGIHPVGRPPGRREDSGRRHRPVPALQGERPADCPVEKAKNTPGRAAVLLRPRAAAAATAAPRARTWRSASATARWSRRPTRGPACASRTPATGSSSRPSSPASRTAPPPRSPARDDRCPSVGPCRRSPAPAAAAAGAGRPGHRPRRAQRRAGTPARPRPAARRHRRRQPDRRAGADQSTAPTPARRTPTATASTTRSSWPRASTRCSPDTDADGHLDGSLGAAAARDADLDGLDDALERVLGLNPQLADSRRGRLQRRAGVPLRLERRWTPRTTRCCTSPARRQPGWRGSSQQPGYPAPRRPGALGTGQLGARRTSSPAGRRRPDTGRSAYRRRPIFTDRAMRRSWTWS